MDEQLERMRALVAQAVAEAERQPPGSAIKVVHLALYGDIDEETVRALYAVVSQGTPASAAGLEVHPMGAGFICWNCCGLRFEGEDGVCPNCGEEALELPSEIAFGLRSVEFE